MLGRIDFMLQRYEKIFKQMHVLQIIFELFLIIPNILFIFAQNKNRMPYDKENLYPCWCKTQFRKSVAPGTCD
jgi:hypothetical protein